MKRQSFEHSFGPSIRNLSYVERLLHNMKLLHNDTCTVAGLVLFGKKSYFKVSQFYIAAVSWYGKDVAGVDYRESEDIHGNIARLYEDGMAFIKRQM